MNERVKNVLLVVSAGAALALGGAAIAGAAGAAARAPTPRPPARTTPGKARGLPGSAATSRR